MNKLILFVLILYLEGALLDNCEKHRTCRACIRDASVCVWCASTTYSNEQRCKPKSVTFENSTWCSDLQNPDSNVTATENEPYNSDTGNVTQLRPQRYQLNLRPGEPKQFSFSIKWADNYPVDIYFLLDSSNNMIETRSNTAKQSENIYLAMKNKTSDVFMGVGAFVDKNMLPYTLDIDNNKAYSFSHRLNFTPEYRRFQKAIEEIPLGENRDPPESGLDALAQAIVCQRELGWRIQSRKIVVLMTAAPSHGAGDGKSAGLFTPYDEECYTKDNKYTKELTMDYPSVSMINKLARENHVIVIFAVASKVENSYRKLPDYIIGSKMVSLLSNMASNNTDIVTSLKKIYEDISTKIKLKVNMQTDSNGSANRKNFKISFDPDCTENISACNATINEVKNITATITVLEYDEYDNATIDVAIEGIAEKLTLDINIINDCDCKIEAKSEYCNDEKRECGICQCTEPKYGDACQCNSRTLKFDYNATCQTENMKKPCSGQGSCSCGKCVCLSGFAGPYCECSLKNCPMAKGIVCGGTGDCQCDGQCKCNTDWSGNACECHDRKGSCMAPNNKVCNARGKCNCGNCACDDLAPWDKRNEQNPHCTAKPCPGCHSLQCKILTDYALCLLDEKKDCNCSFVHDITRLDTLSEILNYTDANADWQVCKKVRVDMGCYTNFAYMYDEDEYGIHLMLQKDRNCAEIQYIYGGVVLLCVLLVGIFTLLGWKLITYMRDRREYLLFMKNHVPDSTPCDNPLYEPATTTFRNPAFGKQSIQ